MPVARAIVELGTVSRGLTSGLAAATKQLRKFATNVGAIGRRLSIGLTLPIAAAGVGLFKLGADAVESENLFSVSMGKMSDSARKWSEDLSSSLGLNAFEIRENVAQLNVMLGSMGLAEDQAFDMSKSMTALAQDMASFFNIKPEVAFEKLRSGITGETEPLKRLGILVNENTVKQTLLRNGIVETTKGLTEQQKVLGRYIAIMEQTGKAQGDLARTMNSPANQMRRLRTEFRIAATELAVSLLPAFRLMIQAMTRVAGFAKNLADRFNALSAKGKVVAIAIAAIAAGIGPLLILTGLLAGAFAAFVAAVTAIISPIGLVIAAFAALGVAMVNLLGTGGTFFENMKSGFKNMVALLDVALGSWEGFKAVILVIGKQIVLGLQIGWLKLKEFLSRLWVDMAAGYATAFVTALAKTNELFSQAWAFIKRGWARLNAGINDLFDDLLIGIADSFDNALPALWKFAEDGFGRLWTIIKFAFANAWASSLKFVTETLPAVWKFIKDGFALAWSNSKKTAEFAADSVSNAWKRAQENAFVPPPISAVGGILDTIRDDAKSRKAQRLVDLADELLGINKQRDAAIAADKAALGPRVAGIETWRKGMQGAIKSTAAEQAKLSRKAQNLLGKAFLDLRNAPRLSDTFKPLFDSIENAFKTGGGAGGGIIPSIGQGIAVPIAKAGKALEESGTKAAQNFKAEFIGIEDLWKRISSSTAEAISPGSGGAEDRGPDLGTKTTSIEDGATVTRFNRGGLEEWRRAAAKQAIDDAKGAARVEDSRLREQRKTTKNTGTVVEKLDVINRTLKDSQLGGTVFS